MKLLVKVSFNIEHPFKIDESFTVRTYGIADVAKEVEEDDEVIADLIAHELCPYELDIFAEVEDYKVINDEQFAFLQELLPVFIVSNQDVELSQS